MQDHNLPFPRGQTFSDGVLTMTDQFHSAQEGRVYEVDDTVHGTGVKIKLRVVKNDTGAAITVTREFAQFSGPPTGHGDVLDFGRRIGRVGVNLSAHGVIVKPIDDAYTVGQVIPAGDLFYVIESGWATVLTEGVLVALPARTAIAADAAGRINGAAAAAGQYVVGTMDGPCYTVNTAARIWVNEGILNEGA